MPNGNNEIDYESESEYDEVENGVDRPRPRPKRDDWSWKDNVLLVLGLITLSLIVGLIACDRECKRELKKRR